MLVKFLRLFVKVRRREVQVRAPRPVVARLILRARDLPANQIRPLSERSPWLSSRPRYF
jgi:hypothetical protein